MKLRNILVLVLAATLAGCAATGPRDTVSQFSTIDALLAGAYDGQVSCAEMLTHGDFGIGTFDGLDGEMAVIDGNVYQIRSDGKVYVPNPNTTSTPFASICEFTPDTAVTLKSGATYEDVQAALDEAVPNQNIFCAIRIDGEFRAMHTRSVPGQVKPYPPLKEVTANQPEFEMENVVGTIVGFRCPPFVKGVNVPGYHLHFVSADHSCGGHILGFTVGAAAGAVDVCNRYALFLPEDHSLAGIDLAKDRSAELEEVEK